MPKPAICRSSRHPPHQALRLVLTLLVLLSLGCGPEKPIKIGFVGGLSGRLSDLGTAGRDGVLLAVEDVNWAGGIGGRRVLLIAKDDQHDPAQARKVIGELIDEGVAAIIGHMTSAMTMAVLPLVNERRMLLISPTVSSDELSGLDDHFLRVMTPSSQGAVHLARVAYSVKGARRVCVIFDEANRPYALPFAEVFSREFEALGGALVQTEAFHSGRDWQPAEVASRVLHSEADGFLLVAGAGDAALLCQQYYRIGGRASVFSSGWAMTDEFLRVGGPTVEGALFSQTFSQDSGAPEYLAFRRRFSQRFGRHPDFAAAYAYDAAGILFEPMASVGPSGPLKEAILKKGTFQGVQGVFSLDPFGDAVREHFIVAVKEGRFVTLE